MSPRQGTWTDVLDISQHGGEGAGRLLCWLQNLTRRERKRSIRTYAQHKYYASRTHPTEVEFQDA